MRTALFAVIVANIVCAFDASMFEDMSLERDIFTNLSTAIVTYVELKNIFSLKQPSHIDEINIDNKIYSNINLNMITALLAIAAEGSTKDELISVWDITDKISLSDEYLSELISLNSIKDNELYAGTAIFIQNSVDLKAEFLSICIHKLYCPILKVDFRNNVQTAEIINSWVQETTNNEILHVISPVNIDKDTKIMLVNTVYLNIGWPNLPKAETVQRIFHNSPSKMFFVPRIKFENSMFSHGEIPHWDCKFIEIPSLNDKITVIIFLPNKVGTGNLYNLLNKFSFKAFQSVRTACTNKLEQDMELYLPKFVIQYTENMTNFFHKIPATTMFEDNAHFIHLSTIPLKVSNIVQKISMRFNKEDSMISKVGKRKERNSSIGVPKKLIVDRPFMYTIEINGRMKFLAAVQAPGSMIRIKMRDEL